MLTAQEQQTWTVVVLRAEFGPIDRLPLGRLRDLVGAMTTLLRVTDSFGGGKPPAVSTESFEPPGHVDVTFIHFGSPLHLHVESWQLTLAGLPVLYGMARRIATLPDRVRTDREQLRAEAEEWRAARTAAEIQQLEAWEAELKRRLYHRELHALEIRVESDDDESL